MNDLISPMPRMQPAIQAALVPGQSQPPSAPAAGNALQGGGNALQSSSPNPGMIQAPPQVSPQQVQEIHDHLHDMQDTLNGLLKLPDHELNTKSIFRAAADMVTKHQLHGGKRGIPAAAIASELSSPDFPKADNQGNPPSPQVIRAFLQNHFDQTVMNQAKITQKYGAAIPHVTQEGNT